MDKLSPERRSINMRQIRSKDMSPEMEVRRLLHSLGYRYRLHQKELPGKPDIVFPSKRKVIFVHGCFWHQHSAPNCKITRKPKSNESYWLPKLLRNVERDQRHKTTLHKLGFQVLTIWECEIKSRDNLIKRLKSFLEK
jgi:DNA mismatch endonuclease, patch repair protein